MPYLMNRFTALGGHIEQLTTDLTSFAAVHEGASLIVNCTGLGAGALCDDRHVFPLRGQVIMTTNPGIARGIADENGPLALAYVIPRSRDCVLGGSADYSLRDDVDAQESEAILARCQQLDAMAI